MCSRPGDYCNRSLSSALRLIDLPGCARPFALLNFSLRRMPNQQAHRIKPVLTQGGIMGRFARVLVAVTSSLVVLWESGGVSHAFVSPEDVCVCPTREQNCGLETTSFGTRCVSLPPTLAGAMKTSEAGGMAVLTVVVRGTTVALIAASEPHNSSRPQLGTRSLSGAERAESWWKQSRSSAKSSFVWCDPGVSPRPS